MEKLKVAVDMDEVIVNLMGHWEIIYRVKAGIPISKELVIDNWDVAKTFTELPKAEVYDMLNIPGMFLNCQPIKGSINVLRKLAKDDRFDIHIVTVAKARTAFSEKVEWVEEHLGMHYKNRVIGLTSGLFKAELAANYDVMIEDNHRTLSAIDPNSCCNRILFKHPHNQMAKFPHDFDDAVDNWVELEERLLKLCKESLAFRNQN